MFDRKVDKGKLSNINNKISDSKLDSLDVSSSLRLCLDRAFRFRSRFSKCL